MKKNMVVILISSILLVSYLLLTRNNKEVYPPEKAENGFSNSLSTNGQSDGETPKNIYSIDTLKNTGFSDGEIVVETEVVRTDKYSSYKVSFISEDLKQYALMNVPSGEVPDNGFPVVIVNHGYIDPDVYSTEKSYINTSAYYARQGFLVLKPDYRGYDDSEGDASGIIFRIKYATDVLSLLHSLDSLENADIDNIFMYGHSMGGDVTLRILETSDFVRAASLWAPAVTNFPESSLYFVRKNRSDELSKREKELDEYIDPSEYDQVSVMENIEYLQVPIVIHHGTADTSVPYKWGQDLYQRLELESKDVTFYEYKGDNHDIASNFSLVLSRDVDFFRSAIQR